MSAFNPHHLLDTYMGELNLKNDAALARFTKIAPPVISKIRASRVDIGAATILHLHEAAPEKFPVARIRELLGAA